MSEITNRFATGAPQNLEERFASRAAHMKPSEIRSLFAVADQIRKEQFWLRFPEELIFTFMNEANKEPFYVTVHGFEEEVLGVSVYRSREDIQKYLTILSEGDDVSFQTIIACQSCSSVLFGEKEHLGPGDFTAMESAGYHPDAAPNSYIYFRSYQPGLTPWYIGCDDVELLAAGLVSLLEAAKLLAIRPWTPIPKRWSIKSKMGKVTLPYQHLTKV